MAESIPVTGAANSSGVVDHSRNKRLFVGSLDREKTSDDVLRAMKELELVKGVMNVIMYPSQQNQAQNRGYAFVDFDTHENAVMAREELRQSPPKLWGSSQIKVDWAEPENEVDDETLSKILLSTSPHPGEEAVDFWSTDTEKKIDRTAHNSHSEFIVPRRLMEVSFTSGGMPKIYTSVFAWAPMTLFGLMLLVLVSVSPALFQRILDQKEFTNFKISHNKMYKTKEDNLRYRIFLQNQLDIAKHNEEFARGETTFKQGVTKFADMTIKETMQMLGFRSQMLGLRSMPHLKLISSTGSVKADEAEDVDLPASVDWREKGAVTPIRDQGRCGSCWAFSAVGALEGQMFLKTGRLEVLSPQQLVDCSDVNSGCDGGLPNLAFEFIERFGGLATEAEYNYTATQGDCKFVTVGKSGVAHGYEAFKKGSEHSLKKAVANRGPISVAFSALDDFAHYTEGVYGCSHAEELNHAVLLVGYGTDELMGDYWIVKNSYGTNWGEDGYFKMARNRGTAGCGVAEVTSIPLVSDDGQ